MNINWALGIHRPIEKICRHPGTPNVQIALIVKPDVREDREAHEDDLGLANPEIPDLLGIDDA